MSHFHDMLKVDRAARAGHEPALELVRRVRQAQHVIDMATEAGYFRAGAVPRQNVITRLEVRKAHQLAHQLLTDEFPGVVVYLTWSRDGCDSVPCFTAAAGPWSANAATAFE